MPQNCKTRPQAVVKRVPLRRVIIRGGVRLYVPTAELQANGADVLACVSKHIARRMKGVAGQRPAAQV